MRFFHSRLSSFDIKKEHEKNEEDNNYTIDCSRDRKIL